MTIKYLERVSWGQCWASGTRSGCKRTASHCGHACPGWCPGIYRAGLQWLPWPQMMPGPDSLITNAQVAKKENQYTQSKINLHLQSQINQMNVIKITHYPSFIFVISAKTSRLLLHIINWRNYLSAQQWPVGARPAIPTCQVEGEEIGPQAPAGQSWVLQCWIWAQLPGYFPWCACLLSWLGTCARPERAPMQRTYQGTGPLRVGGYKRGENKFVCKTHFIQIIKHI